MAQKEDYYKALGISRSASADDIRKAYRRLARKYHPDVNPSDKAAEEKFKQISCAYATLSNMEKRRAYDRSRSRRSVVSRRRSRYPITPAHSVPPNTLQNDPPNSIDWGKLAIFGFAVLALSGSNTYYDPNVERTRDGKGRFVRG